MAPHSSTLAWKIPWMEEPVRLQSMGSLRVGHDWATSLSLFTFLHWRRKWQPTPVFLPGESQGRGSLVGCHLWGHTELDTTEVLSISNLGSGTKKCWESASLWIWFPKHIWSENPVPPVYPTDYWGNEEHSMGGGILENGGKGGPDWWTSLETIGVTMRNKSLLCY